MKQPPPKKDLIMPSIMILIGAGSIIAFFALMASGKPLGIFAFLMLGFFILFIMGIWKIQGWLRRLQESKIADDEDLNPLNFD